MAQQINEITKIPSNSEVIKILNQIIKRYNSLGSIYTFKGSVQTYDDLLAIENPEIGDVYNVVEEDEEHQIAAGSNFVWDGTVWDNLGGSLAGLVQSVNGINPDSLGSVLLPLIKNVTAAGGNIVFTKNDDTTIQVNNIKKLYTTWLGQTVDLNNLVEAGIYMCGNNSYAANYENCPVQKSFLLEVQQANDGSMVYQFLTQYNDGSTEAGNQYVRTYQVTNGWSAWRMAGSGSNLTTYTSLEQLGITPGQETFASIHSALPINSRLSYYFNPTANYNTSMYPATDIYGNITCIKSNDSNATQFIFTQNLSESNASYLKMYITYYNSASSYNPQWQELALSDSVVKSVNGIKPTNGNVDITGVPTGTILPFAGNTIPEGFLACNGAVVSRTTYAALFSTIGTTYGSGDGSTTFNLPNLNNNSFLEGSNTVGTVKSAGLPNITGGCGALSSGEWGAFKPSNRKPWRAGSGNWYPASVDFDASLSNSVYGASDTVQPKAVTVKFCIKY